MRKRPKRAVTLRDIAAAAGVSYQTVSRALNGSADIGATTRARILELCRELGYRPNSAARMLRTKRSRAIGVVISDVENPFFGQIVQAIETEAYKFGYCVILANSNEDLDQERAVLGGLLERQVDGLILAPAGGSHEYLNEDVPLGLPIVTINRAVAERETGSVLVQNRESAREATEYLLKKGHRKIGAVIVDFALMTTQERLEGFYDALRVWGCNCDPQWIREGGSRRESARLAALEILSQPKRPTALLAFSAILTEGALLAMRELGLRHGSDVDIVGYDLGYNDLLSPPVPIIRQPTYQIGLQAVRMLIDMIERKGVSQKEVRLPAPLEIPVSMHVRRFTKTSSTRPKCIVAE